MHFAGAFFPALWVALPRSLLQCANVTQGHKNFRNSSPWTIVDGRQEATHPWGTRNVAEDIPLISTRPNVSGHRRLL